MKLNLGTFLYEKRIATGMTQSQVAKELGYGTSQFISNWERGISAPPIVAIATLCRLYRVSEEELFELIVKSSLERTEASLRAEFQAKVKSK